MDSELGEQLEHILIGGPDDSQQKSGIHGLVGC